jgi:hypothetical protein
MHTRIFYNDDVMPKYLKMLDTLDNAAVGYGELKRDTIDACNSLNNILDYFADENHDYLETECGMKVKNRNNRQITSDFREKICSQANAIDGYSLGNSYAYIRDIADCGKHLNLGRSSAEITHSEDIRESLATIRYSDENGYYYSHKNLVLFTRKDNFTSPSEIYIYFAFHFITRVLISAGVIDSPPKLPRLQRDFYISRSDADELGPPKMRGKGGEHFDMQLSSYIYEIKGPAQIRSLKNDDEFDCIFPVTFDVDETMYKNKDNR